MRAEPTGSFTLKIGMLLCELLSEPEWKSRRGRDFMEFLPMLRSLLILFVCLAFAARADDPRELHLLCWTEYVTQKVIDGFSKQASAHVLMENYNSNAQMLAALRAKPGYFD